MSAGQSEPLLSETGYINRVQKNSKGFLEVPIRITRAAAAQGAAS